MIVSVQAEIELKLSDKLNTSHLEVINESNNHNVPAGSESHFKVILVSKNFEEKNLLSRHRMVNKILEDELKNKIHALAIHAYTEKEWQEKNAVAPESPPCLGGGK
ncbi:MAG: BolA/IbaG family iron-sulfur metabolism protein [Gammaproteobacteria bacterium]|nr:BolA/IbaG family iron-sulfur metabolism protein [Gammaproteobacteria bacterium]